MSMRAAFASSLRTAESNPPRQAVERFENPLDQPARVLFDVRLDQHAGGQGRRLAVSADLLFGEADRDPVEPFGVLFAGQSRGQVGRGELAARDGRDDPAVLAEFLIRIGLVAQPDALARLDEADCARSQEELGFELGAGRQRDDGGAAHLAQVLRLPD